jgi:RNA polymerase sigma-70 factor, ECF subfamily
MAFRDELEAQIPAMRRYARALTRNRETADDLVQEALMRALDAEPRWHAGNIRSWLFTILTNVNRNRLRALGRRAQHEGIEAVDPMHATPGPSGEARDIVRALDSLSTDQREVLLLVALEGLSYSACAQVLSVPTGTVMSRLSRARSALRAALDSGKAGAPRLRVVK